MRRVVLVGVVAGITVGAVVIIRRQRRVSVPAGRGRAEWPPLQTYAQRHRAPSPPWVDAVDGQCPPTHPVKGNAASRIFHVPGGRFYESTKASRCFIDTAAAEADGYRASKR